MALPSHVIETAKRQAVILFCRLKTASKAEYIAALGLGWHGTKECACDSCGEMWPIALLDAKPGTSAGANPEAADFERFECPHCYGPGWNFP